MKDIDMKIDSKISTSRLACEGAVKYVGEWVLVSNIPSSGTKGSAQLDEKFTKAGVYQVALVSDIEEIGEAVVHPKIGYTGMSENIHSRRYDIRNSVVSDTNVKHGCGRYIRQSGWDLDQVAVRILYTCPKRDLARELEVNPIAFGAKELEDLIHAGAVQEYGQRYMWKEASGGNAGKVPDMLDMIKSLSIEELFDMRDNVVAVLKDKLYAEADASR